jgi:hypothetical protein
MASPAPNRPSREVVEFPHNIAVTVALKYGQGKTVAGQYGERFMFSLADGRVMFLDPSVAGQIAQLGINIGENFTITKQSDGRRDSPIAWHVARTVGEQPNGTFVAPAPPIAPPIAPIAPIAPGGAPAKPPTSAATAVPVKPSMPDPEPGRELVDHANLLIDAFAEVLQRALSKYEGRVKPDECRAIFLTAVINMAGGKHR